MPDIHIHRPHQLGMPQARLAAQRWADKARQKFDMECTYVEAPAPDTEGEAPGPDTLHFQRPGMEGTLQVAADRFELQAELGFLFSAFKDRIEQELQAQFDKLLLQPAG